MYKSTVDLNRRDMLAAVALGMVVLVLGGYLMVVGVCGLYHDDAIYVITAKALAHDQGYRLINIPHSPAQTKYPIIYPALLAVIWCLWPSFPENLLAMQSLSLLASAITIGLCYLYLVRFGYCKRSIAASAGLLCATSSEFLYFSTVTLSEMPFALLLIVTLWELDRYVMASYSSRTSQLLLGVFLCLPFLCRTIGLPFIAAGLIIVYLAKRPVKWVALGSAIVFFPWIMWAVNGWDSLGRGSDLGYYTDYISWWKSGALTSIGDIVFYNLLGALWNSCNLAFQLFSKMKSGMDSFFQMVIVLFVGAIPWVIIMSKLRQFNILAWFLISYLTIILLWPWPPGRFLVPILPILLPYLLIGIIMIRQRLFSRSLYQIVATAGLSVIVIFNLVQAHTIHQKNQLTGLPFVDSDISWSSYERTFDWLRANTPVEAVVASGLDTMIYLYTGRQGFRPFKHKPLSLFYGQDSPPLGTVEELIQFLDTYHTKYLVHFPMPRFAEEKPFAELIEKVRIQYPDKLKPIYTDIDKRFMIFEVMFLKKI
ncbi:MAG: hypothetical protein SRB2_00756 [Desulfobacteraceae bacterium Eth-SRB2]|nr:MAG: hypothetical protein SRB2_00756 [Desulfobacteraceae bacterium Eth-SRB2]